MKKSLHIWNAGIAALLTLVLFISAQFWSATPVQAQTASLQVLNSPQTIMPGATGRFNFTLTNTGVQQTFTLSITTTTSGVQATFPTGNQVIAGGATPTVAFDVDVFVPSTAVAGTQIVLTLNAAGTLTVSTFFTITVGGATPTPSPTLTPTVVSSTTPTAGLVCVDGFEPDSNPASAKVIDVNTVQQHTICPVDDEDWLIFGGVAGKVYTIDVSRQDPGIDLTLELFDANLTSIAFNDDFYDRVPTNPNPGDTKPRITIRIPADGVYYIKVRDAAGRGGINYIYDIALIDESYGPTPTMVREICQDLFEPDGLPEQARLITSNERHESHRLCPEGDADWVMFFGKANKRYIIFTDTRRYATPSVNGDTQAGADTVMILTDRDGVSVIDMNDDIPGGNSLDSQIEFVPEVDGFYFVQVKNVGDIGNQFIRYDLTLLLCTPGQTNCGRGSVTSTQPVNPITPLPTGTPDKGV